MANETLLVLTGAGVAPYSARGLRQTLTPIAAAGQFRRTVNGTLVNLSLTQFRKYASTITGSDQRSPAVGGIWPGKQVTVECIAELCYSASGSADRTVVSGSSHSDPDGYVYYRPVLTMFVTGYSLDYDEYGAAVGWTMTLEEV